MINTIELLVHFILYFAVSLLWPWVFILFTLSVIDAVSEVRAKRESGGAA